MTGWMIISSPNAAPTDEEVSGLNGKP